MDIFKDSTSKLPKQDGQIKKVDFEKGDLIGKPPTPSKSGDMAIRHVPSGR